MERTSVYWELLKRIEEVVDERKDIITNDDGYVVFWPTEVRGSHTSHELRILADILDDRNKAWDEEVNRELMR